MEQEDDAAGGSVVVGGGGGGGQARRQLGRKEERIGADDFRILEFVVQVKNHKLAARLLPRQGWLGFPKSWARPALLSRGSPRLGACARPRLPSLQKLAAPVSGHTRTIKH